MIVIDASVLANALLDDGALGERCRAELREDPHWAAPEHLLVETFSVIRGRHQAGHVSRRRATHALAALRSTAIDLVSTAPLLTRMWELRDNVSGYDAAYVAAAELAGCALATVDARLAHATGIRCPIRLTAE